MNTPSDPDASEFEPPFDDLPPEGKSRPQEPEPPAFDGGFPPPQEAEVSLSPPSGDEPDPTPEPPHGEDLEDPDHPGFLRLHPRIRVAWLVSGVLRLLVLGSLCIVADLLWMRDKLPTPPGVAGGGLTLLLALEALLWPGVRYRNWRYAIRDDDVLLCHGVIWQVRRSIPRLRVQHVDIVSGPLERWFGLTNLILYTAGTGDADARIPGLGADVAETLRERLLEEDWAHA